MIKGKLIVFEGIDGSGKTTQIELLKKYLDFREVSWEIISFPQYGKNEYAKQVEDYLAGKFGQLKEVDPYFIAKAYASDRQSAKQQIEKWLLDGKLVIANRYASASQAHLGANLTEDKRADFFKWLDGLEYEQNGIPVPDLTILLDVDPKLGQENVQVKNVADIHENNLTHLEKAREIYLQLAKENPNWYVADCMEDGVMKTKEEIDKEVIKILEKFI